MLILNITKNNGRINKRIKNFFSTTAAAQNEESTLSLRINYADGSSDSFALRSSRISSRILRPWLLLFYAERIPVALPTDSVNAFESEIVDAGFKSRRRLIQSGMVIACVARGQENHQGLFRGVGRRAAGWQTTSPNCEG